MNIVIFSNAPIKKITEALNLPFSPKEGWVSAAIAMLQTVECNIFYVFPQRKTKEVTASFTIRESINKRCKKP